VYGGKITTFRKLSEQAVNLIAPVLNNHASDWTGNAHLPGGDIAPNEQLSVTTLESFVLRMQQKYAFLPPGLVLRYTRAYGSKIDSLLEGCSQPEHMGECIADGLYAIEVRYLVANEWARCAEDILWRRTKLGLHLPKSVEATLDRWLQQNMLLSIA